MWRWWVKGRGAIMDMCYSTCIAHDQTVIMWPRRPKHDKNIQNMINSTTSHDLTYNVTWPNIQCHMTCGLWHGCGHDARYEFLRGESVLLTDLLLGSYDFPSNQHLPHLYLRPGEPGRFVVIVQCLLRVAPAIRRNYCQVHLIRSEQSATYTVDYVTGAVSFWEFTKT